MKYNNQWRKKKLSDVCKVVRFMSNGNFKETESEDSTFFSMNIPLWTTILCSSITDGFHFIAEILPPSGKKFDQEALKIKIDAFKGIPSKYEMVLCVNENGCPRLTMYIPYNLADNMLQISDPISVFMSRLYVLAQYLDEYGL